MFALFKKQKAPSKQELVIDWLQSIAQRQPQIAKEIELLVQYWTEPGFTTHKHLQIQIPTFFTEWIGRVDLTAHYETSTGRKPCTMFNAVTIMHERITPINIEYQFNYHYDGLHYTRTINMASDVQPLLNAAAENDLYEQKAALTLHYLTAIYATKIVRHQFLIERRKNKNETTN